MNKLAWCVSIATPAKELEPKQVVQKVWSRAPPEQGRRSGIGPSAPFFSPPPVFRGVSSPFGHESSGVFPSRMAGCTKGSKQETSIFHVFWCYLPWQVQRQATN